MGNRCDENCRDLYKEDLADGLETVSIPDVDVLRKGANRIGTEETALRNRRCAEGRPQVVARVYQSKKSSNDELQRRLRDRLDDHFGPSRHGSSGEQYLRR